MSVVPNQRTHFFQLLWMPGVPRALGVLATAFTLSFGFGLSAKSDCRGVLENLTQVSNETREIAKEFSLNPDDIILGKKIPFVVLGREGGAYSPKPNYKNPVRILKNYDVIVIGGGPAGLMAAFTLTDKMKTPELKTELGVSTLLLEKYPHLGGLAAEGDFFRTQFARGGAYFTPVSRRLFELYRRIGVGYRYKSRYKIEEHTDSYLWNGVLYGGLWENPKALMQLPGSFELFKYVLEKADDEGLIPTQPIEDYLRENPESLFMNYTSMSQWVKEMPAKMEGYAKKSPKARKILERFQKDIRESKISSEDPMIDVIHLLDLYGRSALGDHASEVNAAAFANFYISELTTRYTGMSGNAVISESIMDKLTKTYRKNLTDLSAGSEVTKVVSTPDGVEVYYVQNGQTFKVVGKRAIFAAPLNAAPKVIENFEKIAPDHFREISTMKYRHYMVINVLTDDVSVFKGSVNSYDTWVRNDKTYSKYKFTDAVDGRFQELNGNAKINNTKNGIITIYYPLPEEVYAKGYSDALAVDLAQKAISDMKDYFRPVLQKAKKEINVKLGVLNWWGDSIFVPDLGHFDRALVLRNPIGANVPNIWFANNNMGVPSVEEGLFRGDDAAKRIRELIRRQKETAQDSDDKNGSLP